MPSNSEKDNASLDVCFTAWCGIRSMILCECRWETPKLCLMAKVKAAALLDVPPEWYTLCVYCFSLLKCMFWNPVCPLWMSSGRMFCSKASRNVHLSLQCCKISRDNWSLFWSVLGERINHIWWSVFHEYISCMTLVNQQSNFTGKFSDKIIPETCSVILMLVYRC